MLGENLWEDVWEELLACKSLPKRLPWAPKEPYLAKLGEDLQEDLWEGLLACKGLPKQVCKGFSNGLPWPSRRFSMDKGRPFMMMQGRGKC